MRLFAAVFCLLAVCGPNRTGSAQRCFWTPESKQGLVPGGLGQVRWRSDVSEPARCQDLCCSEGCDLALLGLPADGAPRCALVRCPDGGCALEPSDQFLVYRRLKVVPYANLPSSDTNTTRCVLPVKVGHCRAAFPRFYYDVSSQACRLFTYGGCGGNDNNFVSQETCEALCGGVTGPAAGPPGEHAAVTLPASKKVASPAAQCSGAPDPGPCRAAFTMFYYDAAAATCRAFIYGGCHGNMNRHASAEQCLSRCSDQGPVSGRGQLRNRWTTAFFILLTLAGVSALLVAALIVITVRRRLPRPAPSLSDKEELLQDPDEPSLDSLSIAAQPDTA